MKTRLPNSLLARMERLQPAAFRDFDRWFSKRIFTWCTAYGMNRKQALQETPRCLFELSLMVAQRSREIENDLALENWVHCATRGLIIDYWRRQEQAAQVFALPSLMPVLTPLAARELTPGLDGRRCNYRVAARRYGLPVRWVRRQHRRMMNRIGREWKPV
jgi:hypothetical protein